MMKVMAMSGRLPVAPTRALAEFVAALRYEGIPGGVRERAKLSLLDALGCGLCGAATPWAHTVIGVVEDLGGPAEATIWARGVHRPCANVALALGTMIHAQDYDDYHTAKVHPGAAVVPAALTLAEKLRVDGRRLLTAVVAGYETMIRVSLGTGPAASRLRGWHLTGTCGTFGAAAAAASLLGLGEEGTAWALGLAGTQAAGLWAFTADGAWSKRLHPGRSAQSGILAALLAGRGYRGPTQILEAEDGGFCRATSDATDLSRITEGLGVRFHAGEAGLKPYAACASLHSAIDGALALRAQGLTDADVARLVLRTSRVVQVQCGSVRCGPSSRPAGMLQAQMSAQYCLAAALRDGQLLARQFADDRLADPEILELAARVEVRVDPEMDAMYPGHFANIVEAHTRDGAILVQRVDDPLGSPARPLEQKEVEEKFRDLGDAALDPPRVERILQVVGGIESLPDAAGLAALLA
jgi:2-methylcitrate dehydratase PrpD